MRTAFVVRDGVVTDTIVVEDDTDLSAFGELLGASVVVGRDGVGTGWRLEGTEWIPPVEPPLSLDALRAAKIEEIQAKALELLAAGAPVGNGLHVALDDGSRADITAMAATATAAASGALPWPESYARGWITLENVRIALATPVDGLKLAGGAGNFYAALVQNRRDLKDAVLAAKDETALGAIDVSTGWPS